jgi:hypothetical protein
MAFGMNFKKDVSGFRNLFQKVNFFRLLCLRSSTNFNSRNAQLKGKHELCLLKFLHSSKIRYVFRTNKTKALQIS